MLVLELDWKARGHVAAALKAHVAWCRRQSIPIPAAVVELLSALTMADASGQTRPGNQTAIPTSDAGAVLISFDAAAARLGVSTRTVRRLVAAGQLHAVTIGSRGRRVHVDDLTTFIEQGKTA